MQSLSFQKAVINSVLVDEVSFDDVPGWLFGMLMDDAMSCDTPWMNSLFAVAATRYGDWLKAYASAWIGDQEVLVTATTDLEAANEFAKDYDCRIEVLASNVTGVGDVIYMMENPTARVLDAELEMAAV